MYKQTEGYFNQRIQKYGCNFFSCLAIAELEAKNKLGAKARYSLMNIEDIYVEALGNSFMDRNCFVFKPGAIIRLGYKHLTRGGYIKAFQVGAIEGDEEVYWAWVGREYKNYKYQIVRWETFKGGEHFVLWDREGEIYDPYEVDVKKRIKQKLLYYIGDN